MTGSMRCRVNRQADIAAPTATPIATPVTKPMRILRRLMYRSNQSGLTRRRRFNQYFRLFI
jgi:hypothetical protein